MCGLRVLASTWQIAACPPLRRPRHHRRRAPSEHGLGQQTVGACQTGAPSLDASEGPYRNYFQPSRSLTTVRAGRWAEPAGRAEERGGSDLSPRPSGAPWMQALKPSDPESAPIAETSGPASPRYCPCPSQLERPTHSPPPPRDRWPRTPGLKRCARAVAAWCLVHGDPGRARASQPLI